MSVHVLVDAQWPHECYLRDMSPGPGMVVRCDDCGKFYTGYKGEHGWLWCEISLRKAKRLINRQGVDT